MGDLEKSQKKVSEVAKAALNMAEKKGLTLHETMWLPEVMKNIVNNELMKQKIPYKRG